MEMRSFLLFVLLLFIGVSAVSSEEIHEAARVGDLARVRELVGADPESINARADEDETPLHSAIMGGHIEIVTFLLEQGAEADARNSVNQSPLLYAAYQGFVDIMKLLHDRGAALHYLDTRGMSPIHFAARQGQTEAVAYLLANGVETDPRNGQGITPFFLAAMSGREETAGLLADRGADINVKNNEGDTPLLIALQRRHRAIIELLMSRGVDVATEGEEAAALLKAAALTGSRNLVDFLVSKDVDFGGVDESGRTLLHCSVIGELTDLSRRLIEQGWDINAADMYGKTPLHYSVSAHNMEITGMLLENGADCNIASSDGRTPLHIAIDWRRDDMIQLLRSKGAKDTKRKEYSVTGGSGGADVKEPLEITYIANEGFMISCADEKVMIDALTRNPWGYASTPDPVFELMCGSEPPFDGLDIAIASHAHLDHNHPEMTFELLEKAPGIVFVSLQQSVDDLMQAAGESYAGIEDRVRNVNPDWGTTVPLTAQGIDMEFFAINHAGPDQLILTLATVVDIGGMRVVHLADNAPFSSAEYYRAAALHEKGVDIAFIDPFFLQDSVGTVLLEECIRPEHIILMHLRDNEIDRYKKELESEYPQLIIFTEPMETRVFRLKE